MRRIIVTIVTVALIAVMAPATASAEGFERGVVLIVDDTDYYLAGAPDGPGGSIDIPGHSWVVAGNGNLVGKHYNTGPFGAPQWWSSDAPDGELLYMVYGVIDEWTPELAEDYAARGFMHYHELVSVTDGSLHPTKVVWLRHHARTSFALDGGPRPDFAHEVKPGIDLEFINNYFIPYEANGY